MARARAGKGVRGHRKGNKKKEGGKRGRRRRRKVIKKKRKKQTWGGRKKERREKKKFLRWIFKTQQTRYTGRVLGGNQRSSLFQMEIHIIPSSYGNVLLFPDFAIFAVPRVRQTKGKRHLNFQTVLYPPINVAMKIDPPSMTNYNHRCIRKHATEWVLRPRIGLVSTMLLRFSARSSRGCRTFQLKTMEKEKKILKRRKYLKTFDIFLFSMKLIVFICRRWRMQLLSCFWYGNSCLYWFLSLSVVIPFFPVYIYIL